jgi:hypothetical protein
MSQDVALERHYTVFEIAERWGVSHMTIRRLFENEPDVLRFGADETRYGSKRISLRIPESVMKRVHMSRQCTSRVRNIRDKGE